MGDMAIKQRNSNIELLRVISMLMVVALHYLNQGGILENAVYGDVNYAVSWLVEAASYASVNIYVLISGWMLSQSKEPVRIGKVVRLILEVVFYSVGIYLVFCVAGVTRFNIKTLIFGYLFPLIHGQYWFATVYVVLYLLSPFLNKMLSALTKAEQRNLLVITGCVFAVLPSLFFFSGNSVGINDGYSLIWFIFLYFLADYLRRYPLQISGKKLLLAYLLSVLATFGLKLFQQMILGKELWDWYSYTSVTVLVGSVALFLFFMQIPPKQNRFWNALGKTTFGVFLIHTQYIMREVVLWKQWIKPLDHYQENPGIYLMHFVLSVLLIFTVCSAVDWMREKLFSCVEKWLCPLTEKIKVRFPLF